MWGIFTAYMFIASLRTTAAVAAVFLLLAITFFILGIGNSALAGTHAVTNGTIKLGGYVGIVTAIVAWYASFAAVINSTFGRVVRRSCRSGTERTARKDRTASLRWSTTTGRNRHMSAKQRSAGGNAGALGCPVVGCQFAGRRDLHGRCDSGTAS